MSSLSTWSLTHTVTWWPVQSRSEWDGAIGYGAPVSAPCDYKSQTRTATDSRGSEVVSQMTIYTEAAIHEGAMCVLRMDASATPPDDAQRVLSVLRYADTFEGLADDFEVLT